jgi:hypothetical protein
MIEEPAFYPWMTGRVNLEVLGATGGGCAPGEVGRVLGLAGLSDAIRRRVRVEVRAADSEAAARLLARWPGGCANGQFLVEHDSGRDVNGVLMAGGVVAESVTVERPGLEERFLEITGNEDARAVAAGS